MRLLAFWFLALFFGCTEGVFRRVCEGQVMAIDCGSNVINILSASYGRSKQTPCGNSGSAYCHAATSMRVARFECQGRQGCILHATNSVFGEPCRGTVKYLEVTYQCVYSPKPQHLLRICEGQTQAIRCYGGRKITIIEANYGRLVGGHICPGPIKTTYCGAAGSLSKVRSACQGKAYCALQAKNAIFGDPCHNTMKYLEVRYRC